MLHGTTLYLYLYLYTYIYLDSKEKGEAFSKAILLTENIGLFIPQKCGVKASQRVTDHNLMNCIF